MAETKTAPEQFSYRAEMKQLLHLIIHSLYTHREIFLRELVSNASDALNQARFRRLTDAEIRDADAPLEIRLSLDEEANTLTVEDTGVGMTKEALIERLGTVASSGTLAFVEQLRQHEAGQPLDGQMIGQFGVGFYSAFMVADEVVVETCPAEAEAPAHRWRSTGEGSFTVEEIERDKRGTRIVLHLKEDAKEFTKDYRVKQIVQKYSNFVDFPIYLGEEQVNTVKPLWRKQKSEITDEELSEFYKFVSGDYQEPLGHLHLALEGRVSFRALLFVPKTAPPAFYREDLERGLHLYAKGVFIQDDCTALLPEYLRFVRGVVDTEDLPLNVSREVTQHSPVTAKISQILTGKILGMLEEWADRKPEQFATFFQHFGPLFKTGVSADFANRDRLLDLLRFPSTKTEKGDMTSLKDYVGRMQPDQEEIFYLLAEHRDVAERDPKLEYFQKHDLEVLLLLDPVDVFVIPGIAEYDGKPLRSVEKAEVAQDAEQQKDALEKEDEVELVALFKKILGEKVADVVPSKRLVDSAATLVAGEHGLDTQMERMMRMMNQDFAGGPKVLEINTAHLLLKNLSRLRKEGGHDDLLERAVHQLYEGALLLEAPLPDPAAFVTRMTALMTEATAERWSAGEQEKGG